MSNPGFGLYTNNNYIPGIGQFSAMPRSDGMNLNGQNYISGIGNFSVPGNGVLPVQMQATVTYPGSFTFAVPTQASSVMSTFTPSFGPRELSPGPSGVLGAPGIGVSWQHGIPHRMPWHDAMSSQTSNGISTFTGLAPSVSHYEGYSDFVKGSNSNRRLKRHALDSIKEESPESKVYISEEKMANRMQELSLNCLSSSPRNHCHRSSPPYSSSSTRSTISATSQCPSSLLSKRPSPFRGSSLNQNTCSSFSRFQDGRKRLKEIEDRLDEDLSDEENVSDLKQDDEPRLHFTGVTEDILSHDPILPKQLIQDLSKPCMQVVLWKPPGDNIKKVISLSANEPDSESDQELYETSDILNIPSPSTSQEVNLSDDMEMYDDDMSL